MAFGAIVARILTQYSDKGSKAAQKDVEKLGKRFDNFARIAVRSFAVATAASAAFAIKFSSDSIKAALEAQSGQNRLRQLLLTTNGATEEQIGFLNQQAEALERVGVVSAGNVTVVQSQLATFDLYGKTISTLTPAILDYVTAEKGAAASADQFKSMTNGLAQALNGNFGALTRVGFVLDDATKKLISTGTESERAEAIVKVLNSTYKGFNETLRDTPEGQIQVLKNAFQALQTTVGTALLPVMLKFTDLLQKDILPKISAWVEINKKQLVASFEKAAFAAYDLFIVAVKFGEWIVNNMGLVKGLGIAIASMFVVSKVAAFITVIKELIAVIAILRGTALAAGIAMAFATAGVSVGTAVTALAAIGATALVTKNLFDMMNAKDTPTGTKARRSRNGLPFGTVGSSGLTNNPFDKLPDVIGKNTKAVIKNTKQAEDAITAEAVRQNLARQKSLSGSKTIAIGGSGSLSYGPRGGTTVVVNNAGSVISNENLVTSIVDGIQRTTRRNFGDRRVL